MLIYTSRSIFFLHLSVFFNLSQRICFNLIQTNSLYPSINVTANLKATETLTVTLREKIFLNMQNILRSLETCTLDF